MLVTSRIKDLVTYVVPKILIESRIETVWTWGFIGMHTEDGYFKFIHRERFSQEHVIFCCHSIMEVVNNVLLVPMSCLEKS